MVQNRPYSSHIYMSILFEDGSSNSSRGFLFNWVAVSYQLAFRAVRILQSVHDALDLKTAVEVSQFKTAKGCFLGLKTIKIRKYVIQ